MSDYDPGFEEFEIRVGEGTEFAATLTCSPYQDPDEGWMWNGWLQFDDNTFNLVWAFDNYDGTQSIDMPQVWKFPHDKNSGTYLMNLLEGWWRDFCLMFERVRAKRESAGG